MAKYLSQSINLVLSDLQAAGLGAGGDFNVGDPLPLDCLIVGYVVAVVEAVTGPALTAAAAVFSTHLLSAKADLTTIGNYPSGGQQVVISVSLTGCTMADLTSGHFQAIVYYDRFTKTRFPPSPL